MIIKGIESGFGIGKGFPASGAKPASLPAEEFGRVIGDMVSKVNGAQLDADRAIQTLATGESKGLHEVMIAMEKSSISFQFLAQVRNKALEAYQEIMRMQV